jgi:hypothetical protein
MLGLRLEEHQGEEVDTNASLVDKKFQIEE